MKVFKVGDRVSVRRGGFDEPIRGTVSAVHDKHNALFVTEDGFISGHSDSPFHPCQVRKLVKKKKLRTAWIRIHLADNTALDSVVCEPRPNLPHNEESDWFRFVEVVKP